MLPYASSAPRWYRHFAPHALSRHAPIPPCLPRQVYPMRVHACPHMRPHACRYACLHACCMSTCASTRLSACRCTCPCIRRRRCRPLGFDAQCAKAAHSAVGAWPCEQQRRYLPLRCSRHLGHLRQYPSRRCCTVMAYEVMAVVCVM